MPETITSREIKQTQPTWTDSDELEGTTESHCYWEQRTVNIKAALGLSRWRGR